MNTIGPAALLSLCLAAGCAASRAGRAGDPAASRPTAAPPAAPDMADEHEEGEVSIADPLEPVNRAFFQFNDRLYFWVIKPVATGYAWLLPEGARVALGNFFRHVATPVRLVNDLLQADLRAAGVEVARFGLNTTLGVVGFGDPAYRRFNLKRRDEDLGQTLAVYGLGHGLYLVWPVLGPSSARDTVGSLGDAFLDPIRYVPSWPVRTGLRVLSGVNAASLRLGDYENLKKSALDLYVAVRQGYVERREAQVNRISGTGY